MKKNFIPGLKLSKLFYKELIKEKIEKKYPQLKYATALIGRGSEVLKFDDEMSTDHHWGPRLQIFLKEEDYTKYHQNIKKYFSTHLPATFLGYPTNWSEPDPNDNINQFLELKEDGYINHRIEIWTVRHFLKKHLGLDSLDLTEMDWFTIPEQKLLEFTAGEVFFDNLGELTRARKIFQYYPESIWKLKILAQWERISQEMVFVGRNGGIGDDLGSRIETSRLTRYIMEMAFLLERKYIPYQKWFGRAFKELPIAVELEPILMSALKENRWKQREKYLCDAYLLLIKKHIQLDLIPNLQITPKSFFNRPQLIVPLEQVMGELRKGIDSRLAVPKYSIGTINQFIDSVNILENIALSKKAKYFYS